MPHANSATKSRGTSDATTNAIEYRPFTKNHLESKIEDTQASGTPPKIAAATKTSAVDRHWAIIMLNGAANGAMPAWKQLSDTEIAAVITYTKNNWGNKTGQLVQPADVVAARK